MIEHFPGCLGKTFLINRILAHIKATKTIDTAVMSSGIDATLPSYSTFDIPLDFTNEVRPFKTKLSNCFGR